MISEVGTARRVEEVGRAFQAENSMYKGPEVTGCCHAKMGGGSVTGGKEWGNILSQWISVTGK